MIKSNRGRRIGAVLAVAVTLAGGASVRAATLTTTFAYDNLGADGWTNLFDLNVTAPAGITITDITVHSETNGPAPISLYVHPTTYVGNEGSSAGWVLTSTGTGPSPGFGGGTSTVDVADFTLPFGTYGVAITNGFRPRYTSGAIDYGNADLTIDNGATLRGSFGAQLDVNKTWNGAITYTLAPEPTTAAAALIAPTLVATMRRRRS